MNYTLGVSRIEAIALFYGVPLVSIKIALETIQALIPMLSPSHKPVLKDLILIFIFLFSLTG